MKRVAGAFFTASLWFLTMALSQSSDARMNDKTHEAFAVFAGGCFWCLEADFDKRDGVTSAVSGYAGGSTDNPTYKNHSRAGHYEVVRITYDPARVTFEELLHYFWRHVDPTDAGGQFCDRGGSYRTAVFAADPAQTKAAEKSIADLNAQKILPDPIVTPVLQLGTFWPAEDYHQKYYKKRPVRYSYYRKACGRDKRLSKLWKKDAAHSH